MALALFSPRASAVCLSDADFDGYAPLPGMLGCPAVADCDDTDGTINPAELEYDNTDHDDNCNGRTAPLMGFMAANFFAPAWLPAGPGVAVTPDAVQIGSSSSVTRSGINSPLATGTVVTVDVSAQSGPNCTFEVRTSEPGGPAAWHAMPISGSVVHQCDFTSTFAPPESLRAVRLACGALSSMTVDWLTFQDAEIEFPPPQDLHVTWKDTRLPAGAHSTAVIRDDHLGTLYFGDDVSGVWRYDGAVWEIANGNGADSLVMGGVLGVSDLLPMQDGSGEVYALMGDLNGKTRGGLWVTTSEGDSWTLLASSEKQAPGQLWADATNDDDVAGDPREWHCTPTNAYQAGGHLLEAHSIEPTSGDTLYIANADVHNRGVSIWDGLDSCALPHTGDTLPQDQVGALLRVDALPNGTPALVVGYRARLDGEPSLYVCELPVGGSTCGGAPAVCQMVNYGDGAPDIRDLERHRWLQEVAGVTTEAGVLLVDAGGRPTTANTDCTFASGGLGALYLDDSGAGISVAIEEDIVTGLDLADIAQGIGLTGISFDPDVAYLFLNTPIGPSTRYSWDRAYRVLADELFDPAGAPVFEPLNASPNGIALEPYDEADPYETARLTSDMDMQGAWLEAEVNVRPNVFPARSAPGAVPDFEWLYSTDFAWGEVDVAAGYNGNHGWLMFDLTAGWTDNEVDEVTFNPTDTKADAEGDVEFVFLPGVNTVTELTPQGASTKDVTMAPDGHIWGAHGDLGISHFDATVPGTAADPAAAEIDCLWAGYRTSSQSIHAVPMRDTGLLGEAHHPAIWATLRDQAAEGPNHAIGVVRTLDNGATWEYAGAGFLDQYGDPAFSLAGSGTVTTDGAGDYGERACLDRLTSHVATPFPDPNSFDQIRPAHTFSSGTDLFSQQSTLTEVIGIPNAIRALDEDLAVVWLRPDEDGGSTNGGLLLTVNGGSSWQMLDYDGGDGLCDEYTVFNGGTLDLRAIPNDDSLTPWDGADGAMELLVSVTTGAESESCALARVIVDDLGTTPTVSWDWIPLPQVNMTAATGTSACGVSWVNLQGAALAPWSPEVMITGNYDRNFGGAPYTDFAGLYGGACLLDVNTLEVRRVIDPRLTTLSPLVPVPHPNVADLWVILPELDATTFAECNDVREYAGSFATACAEPIPVLVRGNVIGGVQLTTMNDRPPHLMANAGVWSVLDVHDDSADAKGAYLVVGIDGGGLWRGELSW